MPPKYTSVPSQSYESDDDFDPFLNDEFSDVDSLDNDLELLEMQRAEDPLHSALEMPDLHTSTLQMAFMNMANSILGAGAIGTPFAMKNCGVLGGALALIVLTLLVDYTLRLIVINLKLSGKETYQGTVEHCFGKRGKIVIILTQALFAFGGSIGFCIIIGDTIPHILRSFFPSYKDSVFLSFIFSRNFIILFVTLTISFPLSLSKDISKLAKASALALLSMVVIIVIVLVSGPRLPSEWKGSLRLSDYFINARVFQGISVISFALVCHHNTSFIFHSLKKPSLNRFAKVTHASCFVSMVAIALLGFGGFLIFKDKTKGNILNNFPGNDPVVNIARFCFGFNMLTTYPLEIFVLRDVLRDLYYINRDSSPELSPRAHLMFTSVLVGVTMGISLTTCNLGALFELIGATTASIMAYILPPMCYLNMTHKTLPRRIVLYSIIGFGFATMIISSTQTIINAIHDDGSSHCAI
ncbi:AVT2 [Cyberlindnera jadinii]|uniref:AVT2 protein n=1 Tax=Cyberlindnera jadinii (strain ATCC 18201 / CBS 1600 / BCRC 20928 / JCM 3617 / NBRC 0987 / NRRL Y-1542) TaxID=983966 RepID=A0A0H5CG83_CYBJN|nr:AVT2 [Cyberlindnera jadinii]